MLRDTNVCEMVTAWTMKANVCSDIQIKIRKRQILETLWGSKYSKVKRIESISSSGGNGVAVVSNGPVHAARCTLNSDQDYVCFEAVPKKKQHWRWGDVRRQAVTEAVSNHRKWLLCRLCCWGLCSMIGSSVAKPTSLAPPVCWKMVDGRQCDESARRSH